MNKITEKLESYRNNSILDEDGNKTFIELGPGVSPKEIIKFEKENSIQFPKNLEELLLYSNGINLFGMKIVPIQEMVFFPDSGIITFHSWGNGDFDCLSVGKRYPKGVVVYMNHSEQKLSIICNSLEEWFDRVIAEIEKYGTLFHPMDYFNRKEDGIYKNIEW